MTGCVTPLNSEGSGVRGTRLGKIILSIIPYAGISRSPAPACTEMKIFDENFDMNRNFERRSRSWMISFFHLNIFDNGYGIFRDLIIQDRGG